MGIIWSRDVAYPQTIQQSVLLSILYCSIFFSNQDISEKFDKLDKDRNGVLSPDEVIGVIMESLPGCDESNAKHMVSMFDQNQDGNLDKNEFMQMWASLFG